MGVTIGSGSVSGETIATAPMADHRKLRRANYMLLLSLRCTRPWLISGTVHARPSAVRGPRGPSDLGGFGVAEPALRRVGTSRHKRR